MPTYADELRRLADLLDKDFRGNILKVIEELGFIINSLARQVARLKRAIDPPLADGARTDSKNMFVSPESRTDGTAGN